MRDGCRGRYPSILSVTGAAACESPVRSAVVFRPTLGRLMMILSRPEVV
jgi:hypothetical protein